MSATMMPTLRAVDDLVDRRPLAPGAPRLLWFAFRYSTSDRAVRASVWRRLQKLEAVNLDPGTWAVRAGAAEAEHLSSIATLVRDAGGEAQIDEVGGHPAAEISLASRLERACERLWDELFSACEWYAATWALDEAPWREHVEHLGRLYQAFGDLAARDLVQSRALERAEWVITTHAQSLIGREQLEQHEQHEQHDPARVSLAARGRGRRVQVRARGMRSDGAVAYVARVHPAGDPLWEAAFRAFEQRTYAPDPRRASLRGGVFRWVGEREAEDATVAHLTRRVRLFEATLR